MKQEEIFKIFEETGAILKGHFILTSGLHSDTYMQCAKVLMHPDKAEILCKELAKKVSAEIKTKIDMVVAPAMGGVVVGYEMGRQLKVPTIFCERVEGVFTLRRGFEIKKGANILVVEDVVTTGKSSIETFKCIESHGGKVVGEASIVNRSGEENPLPVKLVSLIQPVIRTFDKNNIPEDLKKVPAVKPGSRGLK